MNLGEFQEMMTKREPRPRTPWDCGCDCDGCNLPAGSGQHCLVLPCTRTRNRRSKELIEAERAAAPPKPKREPKPPKPPKEPKPQKVSVTTGLRGWYVHAVRNKTEVTLAAPEGANEAHAMRDHLTDYGWDAYDFEGDVEKFDLRFHRGPVFEGVL